MKRTISANRCYPQLNPADVELEPLLSEPTETPQTDLEDVFPD
jgi:hypothetical protein